MRSVVVVLPASMCAMMPMLRTVARLVVMSTATLADFPCCRESNQETRHRSARTGGSPSPAVVGEGLVGLGHLVGVLTLLDAAAETVRGVEDLVHEAVRHGLLAALAGEPDE